MSKADIYGLSPVSASAASLTPSRTIPQTVSIISLSPPSTPLATRIHVYAKSKLSTKTLNHSMRVYSYGLAIARECFPEWNVAGVLQETWFCTAMLHDIGTTEGNIASTKLSYEFFAGVLALQLLQRSESNDDRATQDQAESVAEAIFRHQDVQDKGMVTVMTQLIQLGTLLDNIGAEVPSRWVTPETIQAVNQAWPRDGWSSCFRDTVEQEKRLKPYAMVSRIEGFEEAIMKNARTAEASSDS